MLRKFVIGLLVGSCNNPPPAPRAQPELAVNRDRDRVENRLQDHAADIEAAFASGDCPTIALKRAAVEKPENYNPPLQQGLVANEGHVNHRRLEEYDDRERNLGCELEECESFTDITVKDSTPQTVSGTTKYTQVTCYRVRNTIGTHLLSVKVSTRATKGDVGVNIMSATSAGSMFDGETAALAATPIAAFAVRSMEMGNDGIEPEAGWQAVPFTLTVTPVLRQPVTKQNPGADIGAQYR